GGRQERESRQSSEAVNHAMRRMHMRRANGEAERGIGAEDSSDQQSHRKEGEQYRRPDRAASPSQRLTQADRESEHKGAADQKVDDLHPASIAGSELADVMAPRAVARAGGALDQEDRDEEQRPDDARVEEVFSDGQPRFQCGGGHQPPDRSLISSRKRRLAP